MSSNPPASIPDALARLVEPDVDGVNVSKWRSAYAAEVEAHNETKNLHAGTQRRLDAATARISDLETQLGITSRRLSASKVMLENAGMAMPEEPKHTPGDWYACVVCSLKTDAAPSLTRRHACCGRNAFLGPCCHAALERSPEDVASIMAGGGHAPGCRGEGAR